jgi:hypothetical protein
MKTESATLIARDCKVYRFGSDQLALLHLRFRPRGIFIDSFFYVVFHPGVNKSNSFYTLNQAMAGQTSPAIFDLPSDWRVNA